MYLAIVKGGNLAGLLHLMATNRAWPHGSESAATLATLCQGGQVAIIVAAVDPPVEREWAMRGWTVEEVSHGKAGDFEPRRIDTTGRLVEDDQCPTCLHRQRTLCGPANVNECERCGRILATS